MIFKKIMNNICEGYEELDITNELTDEFFSKFSDSKDKVLLVISTFPLRDKVLLYKMFGKSYDGKLDIYERAFINETILPKLSRTLDALGKTRELIYLREIINEDEELIVTVSKKCGLYTFLSERFGKDLKGAMIVNSENKPNAISKEKKDIILREAYKHKNLHVIKLIKPFHETFIKFKRDDESYEDFVRRINSIVYSHLNPDLLNEVKLTYNEDLLNIIDTGKYKVGSEHSQKLRKAYNLIKLYLINQNRKIANPRHYSSIETILKGEMLLEELLKELAKINVRTIELMQLKYGENYDEPSVTGTLSSEDNKYLTDAISVARKRLRKSSTNK